MKVLFVCAENTCRSQMAEGFARHLGLDATSAGVKAGIAVSPAAIAVMAEVGIDISGQASKAISCPEISQQLANPAGSYDAIVSLCAVETSMLCPSTFRGMQLNWNVEDPWGQPVPEFRRIRDEIREKVLSWLDRNEQCDKPP